MPKANVLELTGTVTEVSGHQFLQDGAEVLTIVVQWQDGEYKQSAAVDFYAKKGLDKLTKLEIQVGDKVKLPCQPSSKVKEGTGAKGAFRFFKTALRGDAWHAEILERGAQTSTEIPFDGVPYVPSTDPIPFD